VRKIVAVGVPSAADDHAASSSEPPGYRLQADPHTGLTSPRLGVLLGLAGRLGAHRFARYSEALAHQAVDDLDARRPADPQRPCLLVRITPSIDGATSGRAFSAATFGEVVAVEVTNFLPVQKKPTGTRGVPSSTL